MTAELATAALDLIEIDLARLDAMDRQLLRAIAEHHAGGPVGLATMAATISEPVETLEDVIEPYLMQVGLLARTPRGRQLTAGAWEHLGSRLPHRRGRHRSRRSSRALRPGALGRCLPSSAVSSSSSGSCSW